MAPQPDRQLAVDLVDMDRKEELIIAKQLRACRVSILPRVRGGGEDAGSPSCQGKGGRV